jgi:hypothetical protein
LSPIRAAVPGMAWAGRHIAVRKVDDVFVARRNSVDLAKDRRPFDTKAGRVGRQVSECRLSGRGRAGARRELTECRVSRPGSGWCSEGTHRVSSFPAGGGRRGRGGSASADAPGPGVGRDG